MCATSQRKGELTAVCRKPGLRTARHPSQKKDGICILCIRLLPPPNLTVTMSYAICILLVKLVGRCAWGERLAPEQ